MQQAFIEKDRDALLDYAQPLYENMNGKGAFGSQTVIATSGDGYQTMAIADIDGDEDLDIVATRSCDHCEEVIFWYENLDGQSEFGTRQIDPIGCPFVNFPLSRGIVTVDNGGPAACRPMISIRGSASTAGNFYSCRPARRPSSCSGTSPMHR